MTRTSPNLPHRPESECEVLTIQAILYDEVDVPPLEHMESAAQAHLKIEAELGTIDTHGRDDKFTYGNTGGHRIIEKLDRFDALERNVELLLSSDARKTDQIEKAGKEISSLKAQVGLLVQTSEGYLKIRRRFLEVYKRDIKDHDAPDPKKNKSRQRFSPRRRRGG